MNIIDLATGLDYENVLTANEVADKEDFTSLVVKCSLDGIILSDASGRYRIWNPAMEKMTGLKAEQVLSRHWSELFPEFVGAPVEEAFHATLEGKTIEMPPFSFEAPGGTGLRWVQQRNTPVYNEGNEIVGVLV